MGLWISFVVLTLIGIHQCNTAWLYLQTKDLIQGKPESIYEIGYMLNKEEADMNTFQTYLIETKFWTCVLAAFMLPICLKKELQELHIVSVTLFIAIMVFIFIVFLQLCIFGNKEFSFVDGVQVPYDFSTFNKPYDKGNFYTWVKAICCMLVAFSFT